MKLHWQILVALGLGAKRNWHIFIALIAGILCGLMFPATEHLTTVHHVLWFIGQTFIRLIQMIVIPLVVSAIIVGIASLGDSRQLSKIGLRMLLYFTLVSVIAVVIGATLALTIHPGNGIQQFINPQQAVGLQHQVLALQHDKSNLAREFLNFIPGIDSIAKGNLVSILLFVIIFGCALALIGEINRPVVSFFESVFAATMKITDWVMVAATPGIFALTAYGVAKSGLKGFWDIRWYILTLVAGLLIQLLITYPTMLRVFSKVKTSSLYQAIAEAMMVAFGTASGSATLPVTIACCERRAGISSKICSFVLPLGATMTMDATAMFQTIAVISLTQAYGIHLDPFMILQICVLAIVGSSASGGIPSGGWITIIVILNGIGLTLDQVGQGFTFLFAVDRILDMFRTMVNVTSDTVVASIIADNQGELDFDLLGNQEVWKEVV